MPYVNQTVSRKKVTSFVVSEDKRRPVLWLLAPFASIQSQTRARDKHAVVACSGHDMFLKQHNI